MRSRHRLLQENGTNWTLYAKARPDKRVRHQYLHVHFLPGNQVAPGLGIYTLPAPYCSGTWVAKRYPRKNAILERPCRYTSHSSYSANKHTNAHRAHPGNPMTKRQGQRVAELLKGSCVRGRWAQVPAAVCGVCSLDHPFLPVALISAGHLNLLVAYQRPSSGALYGHNHSVEPGPPNYSVTVRSIEALGWGEWRPVTCWLAYPRRKTGGLMR